MKVELCETGKKDERLEFVIAQTKEAVGTFTEAIRKSSDEQEAVSFRAFTLKTSKEEAMKVFDVIMSIVAIELHAQAEEMIKEYTFFHSVEGEEDEQKLLLHCDKTKKPPTKEEIEKAIKESEEKSVPNAQAVEDSSAVTSAVTSAVKEENKVEDLGTWG